MLISLSGSTSRGGGGGGDGVQRNAAHLSELPLLLLLRLFGPQRIPEHAVCLHGNGVVRPRQRRRRLVAFQRVVGQLHLVDALSRPVIASLLLSGRRTERLARPDATCEV